MTISTSTENAIAKYRYGLGMWNSKPSATSAMPTRIRNASASTLMVGCWSTKRASGPENTIMVSTAMTMAVTITGRLSVMPTAVITESSEKTMSMSMICTMAPT